MKSANTVYLTEDKKTAVAEGDPKAKFLLVRAGSEIAESRYKEVNGAAEMVEQKAKAKSESKPEKAKH